MTQILYPRDIKENGLSARIAAIVEPEIETLGFRLVRVQLSDQGGKTLQIMIERLDGMIDVTECETVSRALSPLLGIEIETIVQGEYNLEISSPGIDRPLVRLSDFSTWLGHMVKLEILQAINGRKRFKGTIMSVEDDRVIFLKDKNDVGENEKSQFTIAVTDMANAKLVLTDRLLRDALHRDKKKQSSKFDETNKCAV